MGFVMDEMEMEIAKNKIKIQKQRISYQAILCRLTSALHSIENPYHMLIQPHTLISHGDLYYLYDKW